MDALARTEKSRAQLLTLLQRHADDDAQAQRIVDQLMAQGLQSDARAAVARAQACQKKGFTVARAREDLAALDVTPKVLAQALEDVFGGVSETASLEQAIAMMGPLTSQKKKLSAARTLIRRGFDEEAVAQALRLEDAAADNG